MTLVRLAGECPDGNTCATIFATDRGTVVVQGRRVSQATLGQLRLAEDEYAVEIPAELLSEVARRC